MKKLMFTVVFLCLLGGVQATMSVRMAESEMVRFPHLYQYDYGTRLFPGYTQGLGGCAFMKLWKATGNKTYFNYVYQWGDSLIDSDGSIYLYKMDNYNLDFINSGKVLFYLYEATGEKRFRMAMDTLLQQFKGQPRTADGGFWHKKVYTHQMWLDGLYMASPFLSQHGATFNQPACIDEAIHQLITVAKHTYDQKTGLFYHGWDESCSQKWANPVTGTSPNFWGRSIGWYAMALVDNLDYIPAMPETRTGNFTMTTIALSTAFESSKASNGYRSKAFETFLANRSMIASRLEEKMAGKLYPSTGFLKDTPLAGSVYNKSNGAFDLNSADVLIPAFLAAYSGKDARTSSLDLFPGLLSMLPNWSISYDGLSKLEFIRKYFKSVTLNHNYTCTYSVSSFSTYSTWQNAGDGLGFVRDVLTNSAVPSSMYDISAVTLTESFNPLLRIQGTLNSGLTLNTEITRTRALSLSISGGQIIETDQNQIGAGTGYKLSDFHPWGFMKGSKVKNDLNLTGNLKYKDMHALLRKIEGDYTQASSGNKTFVVELSGDYTMSKNMNLVLFYDLESSVPLVSSYPVRSSDFGVSIRFSLTR